MTSSSPIHPEHALEQAYIERVHLAVARARDQAERTPAVAADRYSARVAREKWLERLKEPTDADKACFGRIDLDGGTTRYLGRAAVTDEGSKLLVVNWRMPVVAPFYTASRADPQGLMRRRRFQLDESRLLGIVEDTFGDLPSADGPVGEAPPAFTAAEPAETTVEPAVVDAILAEMDRARGDEMRDIVATIEARQFELISDSIDGLLVIQGGPGSGKTAIALHRAAWLLYNHKDELERSGVLVVGPNRAFMEFVSQVLPTLGESSVVQTAVDRLPELEGVRVRGIDTPAVARLKGDIRMASLVQSAVAARVRPPTEDLEVEIGRTRLTVPADQVATIIGESWDSGQTYLDARTRFRHALITLVESFVGDGPRFRSRPKPADVEAAVAGTGGPFDRIWPATTAPEVMRDLFNSRQRIAAAAGSSFTEDELATLQRDRAPSLREEPWAPADMALLDEADAALRGPTSSYGYVLADEAQDLSPMQLRMVLRRSSAARATLVGDIAQSTGSTRFVDWDQLLEHAAIDTPHRIAELAIGYRVPRQIMDLAAQLLPRVAPQIVVTRAVRDGPEAPRQVPVDAGLLAPAVVAEVASRIDGDRSVGVIAPNPERDSLRAALTESGVQAGDILADGLGRQVTVLSAAQAKGLEFDHVIVVDPVGIAGPRDEWAYVYIALTRATRTLSVIYTTPEPFERPEPDDEPDESPPEPAPSVAVDVPAVVAAHSGTVLGARYTEALLQAKFLHADQRRRGTFVPYLAHLQAVAALVLEDGGSEDEAIAALLHDAVEDYGAEIRERIVEPFGVTVARIVAGCTDPDAESGGSWRDRKLAHLRELETGGPQVRRVALAEKLDNARALLRDYRRNGDQLWTMMDVDPREILWYYAALADLFVTERPGDMASELQDTVERLLAIATQPDARS